MNLTLIVNSQSNINKSPQLVNEVKREVKNVIAAPKGLLFSESINSIFLNEQKLNKINKDRRITNEAMNRIVFS